VVRQVVRQVVRPRRHRETPETPKEGTEMTQQTRKPLPTYLSLQQAGAITCQSVKTIRRRISDGTIPAYRFGRRQIRIKLEDLKATGRRIPSAASLSELDETIQRVEEVTW
jgi:excisionase family DNA binding protein